MSKLLIKAVSIISIVLLGIGLSACGNKNVDKKVGDEGDGYAYYASFTPIDLGITNGYISNSKLVGDILYAATYEYDQNDFTNSKNVIHKYNVNTKEDVKIPITVEADGYLSQLLVNKDGSFKALIQNYASDYSEVYYSLYCYDEKGNKEKEINLSEASKAASGMYLQNAMVGSDGNLYFLYESMVVVTDSDGKVICSLPVDNYPETIFEDENGVANISTRSETNWNLCTKKINLSAKALETGYEDLGTSGTIYPGAKGKLIIADDTDVFEYDCATKVKKQLWNWIDVDIASYSSDPIIANEDGTFTYLNTNWNDNGEQSFEVVKLEKKEISTSEKQVITYGCMYLDYEIKNKIFDFNKKNDKYRISVKTYSGDDEYQAGYDKLRMDITNGTLDVVYLNSGDFASLASKGAFAELDSYFDKSFNKEDYFESALEAGKVNGKLYALSPDFCISTEILPKSIADKITEWNYDSLFALRNQYKDKSFIQYGTKDSAFYELFYTAMDEFIDSEKGKCDFCNENFYKILEYANTFPKEIDYNNYHAWREIKEKNAVLCSETLSSPDGISVYTQLYGEEFTYIGYPGLGGNGTVIQLQTPISICSASKNKDAAWEFIAALMSTDGREKDYYNNFPTIKSEFYAMIKKAMESDIYTDENGVEHVQSHGGWGDGDMELEIYAITQAQADALEEAIKGAVSVSANYSDEIYTIMNEELQPYFEGQKSAEEVANIIQSRVSIYLAENR